MVVGEPGEDLSEALAARGMPPVRWDRRLSGGRPARPWPSPGRHGAAFVRLPRSKDELAMTLHATASVLAPDAPVFLYGAKDEGIRSTASEAPGVLDHLGTVAVGGRCRVQHFRKRPDATAERSRLEDWREERPCTVLGPEGTLVSYPGVFGHRRLVRGDVDPGTALLLESVPEPKPGDRVLDFGCGSGIIAAALLRRVPEIAPELVDIDSLALAAARENVPGAGVRLSDRIPTGERYDLIVSNPPFHVGKAESLETLREFVRASAEGLGRDGRCVFVTQRRLPVRSILERTFSGFRALADRGPYRVWDCAAPLGASGNQTKADAPASEKAE